MGGLRVAHGACGGPRLPGKLPFGCSANEAFASLYNKRSPCRILTVRFAFRRGELCSWQHVDHERAEERHDGSIS